MGELGAIFETVNLLLRLGAGVLDKYKQGELTKEELDSYLARGTTHADEQVDNMIAKGIARLTGADGSGG